MRLKKKERSKSRRQQLKRGEISYSAFMQKFGGRRKAGEDAPMFVVRRDPRVVS